MAIPLLIFQCSYMSYHRVQNLVFKSSPRILLTPSDRPRVPGAYTVATKFVTFFERTEDPPQSLSALHELPAALDSRPRSLWSFMQNLELFGALISLFSHHSPEHKRWCLDACVWRSSPREPYNTALKPSPPRSDRLHPWSQFFTSGPP